MIPVLSFSLFSHFKNFKTFAHVGCMHVCMSVCMEVQCVYTQG